LRIILRRLGTALAVLVVIAYLTLFGLIMAERGREGLPARPLSAAGEALGRTVYYIIDHPTTYYWDTYNLPAFQVVTQAFGRSAGLLLVSLALAALLGGVLGVGAALTQRRGGAPFVLVISILGVSTPSFLLAMLVWIINLQLNRRLATPMRGLPYMESYGVCYMWLRYTYMT
jgi:ABC-type dipeptide/oligopeptide/nickel transport system permease component